RTTSTVRKIQAEGHSTRAGRYSWWLAPVGVAFSHVPRSSPGNQGAQQSHPGSSASEGGQVSGRALRGEPRALLPDDGRGRRVRPGDLRHLRGALSATGQGALNGRAARPRLS